MTSGAPSMSKGNKRRPPSKTEVVPISTTDLAVDLRSELADAGPESAPVSLRLRSDLKSNGEDAAGRWVVVVPREGAGGRLDRFVQAALMGRPSSPSRAELQRWIEAGRVTIASQPKEASDKVREGERITIAPMPPPRTTAQAEDGIEFDVLYMDDALVVIDKPAGLVVHPAKGHASGTLVNGLLARRLFRDGDVGEDMRPGIVHRLDKGTSGVMVVARTAVAREALKVQFAAHTIERAYLAICVGSVEEQTFDTMHGRHPVDRVKFSTKVKSGKRAVTYVAPVESLARGRATLVRCVLHTGRTHQIRVHLSESGHATLGDPLYGKPPKDQLLRDVASQLGHQALHATVLGFVHPITGKNMRFDRQPPPDFQRALETLRNAK
ncbi:MAG: RluA family pseudouridine synthase [Polyangiaceae bacterium]